MAVDRLVEREAREAPCRTHEIPLGLAVDADDLPVEGVPEASRAAARRRYGHAAHDVLALAAARPSWRSRSCPGAPTCWPRRCSPHGASRRAASATCCCAARGWGCSPRASCWPRGGRDRARRGRAGGRTGLGRQRAARRGRGVPRGGARGGHPARRAAVTFGPSPVVGAEPESLRPAAALPRRLIVLLIAASRSSRPRRAAGWFPATPLDGPTPTSSRLGGVDLARDGTGAVAYLRMDDGVDHVFVARLSAAPGARPSALTPTRPRPHRGQGRRRRRAGSRSPGSRAEVYATVAAGRRHARPASRRRSRSAGRAPTDSTSTSASTARPTSSGSRPATSAPRACRTRPGRRVAPPLDIDPRATRAPGAAPARRGRGRGLRRRHLGRAARRRLAHVSAAASPA